MRTLTPVPRQTTDRPPSETVSVEYAAARLGLGRNTLYCAIRRGEVPVLRIGRRIVVRRATLDRLLADPAGVLRAIEDGDDAA